MIPLWSLLSAAGRALGKVPWQAWALAAAVAACWWYGEARADQRESEIRAEYELRAAKEADQAAQFLAEETERNRNAEQALNDQLHQAAADHAEDLKDLEARTGRTVADLRAGEQRVRSAWQACLSKPRPAPETPVRNDGATDDGIASAGRILRIAGECDAAVKRWQDTWKAAELAVNAQATGG